MSPPLTPLYLCGLTDARPMSRCLPSTGQALRDRFPGKGKGGSCRCFTSLRKTHSQCWLWKQRCRRKPICSNPRWGTQACRNVAANCAAYAHPHFYLRLGARAQHFSDASATDRSAAAQQIAHTYRPSRRLGVHLSVWPAMVRCCCSVFAQCNLDWGLVYTFFLTVLYLFDVIACGASRAPSP